ncbi:MAG TPA: tyrosine protein kinase, partial [Actinomycetota bacterium]|nr:tyrosine protein kinase [Actinomycetota bacterium]
MTLSIQPGSTDLLVPQPGPGRSVHPYTVHTHYFGFSVPDAGIGAFLYARYMPAFGLSQGGPVIFRGMDNVSPLDVEYHDYRATMPWP